MNSIEGEPLSSSSAFHNSYSSSLLTNSIRMVDRMSVEQSRTIRDSGPAQVGALNGSTSGLDMNSDSQAAAMLRAAQEGSIGGGLQGEAGGGGGGNMSAMLQQQQQQMQMQQQQLLQQPNQVDPQNGGGLNIANEIKRLQQLHQIGAGNPSNALLMNPGSGQHDASTAAFLQMLDSQQQRGNSNRFENPLASSMTMSGAPFGNTMAMSGSPSGTNNNVGGGMSNNALAMNPMQLPSNFFTDARLLMAQNHLQQQAAAVMSFPVMQQQQQPVQGGDTNELPLPSPHSLFHRDGTRRMRGGVIEPFPEKLHRLLLEVEGAGRSDVISFVASGRAFAIHKPDKFFKEIVPLYFRQSRLSSFKRQLNLYGFELINTGPARGGYYHELFIKDRPELCRRMRRVAVKVEPIKKNKEDTIEDNEAQKSSMGNDLGKDHTHSSVLGFAME